MVSFLHSSRNLYHDLADQPDTMVFGDGSAGLVLIPRAVLAKICQQVAARPRTAANEDTEVGGLLIGSASQTEDLFLEDAIPLGIEYQFGPGMANLLDPIIQAIAPGQSDGSTTVLGFYRILVESDHNFTEGDLETLTDIAEMHPSLSGLRCCFLVAPVVESQASLHILIRDGRNWGEIQQVVYSSDPPPILT